MLLGHVVELDPLAMFLNCLGESSLNYMSALHTSTDSQCELPMLTGMWILACENRAPTLRSPQRLRFP